jgi:hypothetical protein
MIMSWPYVGEYNDDWHENVKHKEILGIYSDEVD